MILVTGGAGYLGCILVRRLLDRGFKVRVFDRLIFGEEPLFDIRDRIELVCGDVRRITDDVFKGVEAVVHLAGLSNDPTAEYDPSANYEVNTIATERLAAMSKKAGVRRFTFASTCSIYDRGPSADDALLGEDAVVSPRAAYAVSNYDAETRLLELADLRFCPVVLRQGTIFGYSPRMRYDLVVNTFVKDALSRGELSVFGGGTMWRPIVEVSDIAEAHIRVLEAPEACVHGEIFNVAQKNYRILQLAYEVRDALEELKQVTIHVDSTSSSGRSYRVSTDKIESCLGFRASRSARDSVVEMVRQIEVHGRTDFANPVYYNIQWMTRLNPMARPSASPRVPLRV